MNPPTDDGTGSGPGARLDGPRRDRALPVGLRRSAVSLGPQTLREVRASPGPDGLGRASHHRLAALPNDPAVLPAVRVSPHPTQLLTDIPAVRLPKQRYGGSWVML